MEEKRIYSLNKAAYCISKGKTDYRIARDMERANEQIYYLVFNEDVSKDIREYDNDKKIQMFNHAYKEIRSRINELRYSDKVRAPKFDW
jgi:hypothetical protein